MIQCIILILFYFVSIEIPQKYIPEKRDWCIFLGKDTNDLMIQHMCTYMQAST